MKYSLILNLVENGECEVENVYLFFMIKDSLTLFLVFKMTIRLNQMKPTYIVKRLSKGNKMHRKFL